MGKLEILKFMKTKIYNKVLAGVTSYLLPLTSCLFMTTACSDDQLDTTPSTYVATEVMTSSASSAIAASSASSGSGVMGAGATSSTLSGFGSCFCFLWNMFFNDFMRLNLKVETTLRHRR